MKGTRGRVGVIFDLDGTLADTLQDITNATNVGLRAVGMPERSPQEVRRFVGDGMPTLALRALGGKHPELVDRVVQAASAYVRQHQLDHTRLYPGVAETLAALREGGVPMAVLSNKPHELAVAMVQALCGPDMFAAIEGYRSESNRKPDPTSALRLIERMGLQPADTMLVGDSAVDIETARNAGAVAVAVTWGFRDRDELLAAGPDHLIDEPGQLVDLLIARDG